jgi:hypothetical protein
MSGDGLINAIDGDIHIFEGKGRAYVIQRGVQKVCGSLDGMDIPIDQNACCDRMATQLLAQFFDFMRVRIKHVPVASHGCGIYPKF